MGKVVDMTNRRFRRLLVIRRMENTKTFKAQWLCRCDCGNLTVVLGSSLRAKKPTVSCGCYTKELQASIGKRSKTHGATRDPKRRGLFLAWMNIKARCFNPKNSEYRNYGGRGITIASEWKDNFALFEQYFLENLGLKPGPGYSIDRINVNGHYEPGNIR